MPGVKVAAAFGAKQSTMSGGLPASVWRIDGSWHAACAASQVANSAIAACARAIIIATLLLAQCPTLSTGLANGHYVSLSIMRGHRVSPVRQTVLAWTVLVRAYAPLQSTAN